MRKLLTILLLFTFSQVMAQSPMIVDSVRNNDTWPDLREYALTYFPPAYNGSKRLPLILFFHGAGESGTTKADLAKIYNSSSAGGPAYLITHGQWPDSFYNYKNGKYYQPIVICPQAGGDWSTDFKVVSVLIQELLTRYAIDTNRIYLTGLSAGGWTIWNYSGHYQQTPLYKAAAIVPMSMATTATADDAAYIVADSIRAWGFGDPAGDSWGVQTQNGMNFMNAIVPGIARFTYTAGTGHGGWAHNYDPDTRETIEGHSVNIYEWMLYWTRGEEETAGSNNPPSVSAGTDKSQYYPSVTATLSGSANDDHTIVSHTWSVVSNPTGTSPSINNTGSYTTTVSGLDSIGDYTFRLSATDDSSETGSDDVVISITKPTSFASTDTVVWPDTYTSIDLDTDNTQVQPGDTIYIGPTTYRYIRLNHIKGSPSNPVVLAPLHAPVTISQWTSGATAGIHLNGCQYIHVDGSLATDTAYGFNMVGTDNRWPQFFIYGNSKNIEVNGLYGKDINYGFQIKNDPDCDTATWNDNEASTFVMDSIDLHDFYFDSTYYEGTYIGGTLNTSKNSYGNHGGYRVVCDGDTSYHFGYRMGHIKIHDGTIKKTNNDGIQLVDVRYGDVQIYNMTITDLGANGSSYQDHAMSLGGYMQADIHNNHIENAGFGIFLNGSGDITIRDNTISNIPEGPGIYTANNVDTLYPILTPDSMALRIYGNTIDNVQYGIQVTNYNNIFSSTSQVYDNTVTNASIRDFDHVNDNTIHWQGDYGGTTIDTSLGSKPYVTITEVDTSGSSLTIHAHSSTNSTIQYSINGVSWQVDSAFSDLDAGWYIASAKILPTTRDNRNQVYVSGESPIDTTGPTVNPGSDQTIRLPENSITMDGSATQGTGSITSHVWSKVSGGDATITTPSSYTTAITGLEEGTYVFQLKATDENGLSDSSTVTITVQAAFVGPAASAGDDQTIRLPTNSVTLDGSATEGDGTVTTHTWSKVSGSGGTITTPSSYTSTFTGLTAGTYVLKLKVTDENGLSDSDNVTITVNAAFVGPTAHAGNDQTLDPGVTSTTLSGSATAGDGTIVSYLWVKESGAGEVVSPHSQSTEITGLTGGQTSTFKLTVTDSNGLTGADIIAVTAISEPPATGTLQFRWFKKLGDHYYLIYQNTETGKFYYWKLL